MTLHFSAIWSALPVLKCKFLQVLLEGCHLSLHVLKACGCHILAEGFELILHALHSFRHVDGLLDECMTLRMAFMCLPLLEQCAVFPVCQASFSSVMPHRFCIHRCGPAPPTRSMSPTVKVISAVRVAVCSSTAEVAAQLRAVVRTSKVPKGASLRMFKELGVRQVREP